MLKLFSIFIMLIFSGCSTLNVGDTTVVRTNHAAVAKLLQKSKLNNNSVIIISTVVDINDMEHSSPLGRTISQQLASEFVKKGLKVVELKLRNDVYIKQKTGELSLSRKVSRLACSVKANAIVVGTYSNSYDTVFVNLRIINPTTNIVQSSIDYTIAKNNNIRTLLSEKISDYNF